MATKVTSVVQAGGNARYAEYDGTNGSEIVDQFGDVISDNGTTLIYADAGYVSPTYSCNVGQYVCWRGQFEEGAASAAVDAIPSFPSLVLVDADEIPTTLVRHHGRGSVVAKALGGPQDVTVTLDTPMPDAEWEPTSVAIYGPPGLAGIGGHAVDSWTVVDEDTITVHVLSAVGSLAGSNIVYVAANSLA